jgi:hypothetical protein
MVIINKTANRAAILILSLLIISLAFYLGKTQSVNISKVDNSKFENQIKELQSTISTLSPNAKNIEDLGFQFPSVDTDQNCDDKHPIKIKIDKGVIKYYNSKNKSYIKVKADMCAVSEEVAKTIKGARLSI